MGQDAIASEAAVDLASLAQRISGGERAALARGLNLVEDRRPAKRRDAEVLLAALRGSDSNARRVGLTGPPGVGKSTLAAALARRFREKGLTVGIVAVDPSSHQSRGALLGDRARMEFDPDDDGLFVRSIATAGSLGGLTWTAPASAHVLSAAFDVVIVETTGVGQTEIDIRHCVDLVVMVVQPGSGDTLQFLKAGIMEIPDVLVINKADQKQLAERAASDLRHATELPLFLTSAISTAATGSADPGLQSLTDWLASTLQDLDVADPRRRGEQAWTELLFRHEHGAHGIRTLEASKPGETPLHARIHDLLKAHVPVQVASRLGEEYLRHLRAR